MNAQLTTLGELPLELSVTVSEIGPTRLMATGAPRLALGSPVKIQQRDRLWLGEIVELRADNSVVIEVIHSLSNLDELARLASRFLGKRSAEPAHSGTATLS